MKEFKVLENTDWVCLVFQGRNDLNSPTIVSICNRGTWEQMDKFAGELGERVALREGDAKALMEALKQ